MILDLKSLSLASLRLPPVHVALPPVFRYPWIIMATSGSSRFRTIVKHPRLMLSLKTALLRMGMQVLTSDVMNAVGRRKVAVFALRLGLARMSSVLDPAPPLIWF